MFVLALVSEVINERSFISMSEDFWLLPFLIALRTLPSTVPPWSFYVSCSVLYEGYISLLIMDLTTGAFHSAYYGTLFSPTSSRVGLAQLRRCRHANSQCIGVQHVGLRLVLEYVFADKIIGLFKLVSLLQPIYTGRTMRPSVRLS